MILNGIGNAIGPLLAHLPPRECASHLRNAGYATI